VFVNADLTPAESKAQADLRQEKRKLNENLPQDEKLTHRFIIRNNIVVKGPLKPLSRSS
jgi:hypothetical protein